MRQAIGLKKLARLRRQAGLPIIWATVRGGTEHRIDLALEGGRMVGLYPNGRMQDSLVKWQEREEDK